MQVPKFLGSEGRLAQLQMQHLQVMSMERSAGSQTEWDKELEVMSANKFSKWVAL